MCQEFLVFECVPNFLINIVIKASDHSVSMANSGKKQDIRDLENLIRETDERHNKAMEEMREYNAKALEELKLMIAGFVI